MCAPTEAPEKDKFFGIGESSPKTFTAKLTQQFFIFKGRAIDADIKQGAPSKGPFSIHVFARSLLRHLVLTPNLDGATKDLGGKLKVVLDGTGDPCINPVVGYEIESPAAYADLERVVSTMEGR